MRARAAAPGGAGGVAARADGGGDARHRQPARGQLREPVRAGDAAARRRRRDMAGRAAPSPARERDAAADAVRRARAADDDRRRRRLGRMVDPAGRSVRFHAGAEGWPAAPQEHVGISFGWRMRYMALQAGYARRFAPRGRRPTRSCSTARWCSRERRTTRAACGAARDGDAARWPRRWR